MKIGDLIPQVLGVDQEGREHRAADYAGQRLIIYFYPKDNTPGCTAEACSLSEGYGALRKAGFALLGVSKDSAASHGKFAAKYALPFPLIADVDLTLQQQFGVWREKKMAGRTYMGTVRTTFLIDEQGRVSHIIEKVNTKDAARQILELIEEKQ
ncbi:MAG: peroxiredoxin [Muribaculaceae bacterium]|nr:peroxiredoxin [Muribaculaceae bacterium]